jgi:hypothetical protein
MYICTYDEGRRKRALKSSSGKKRTPVSSDQLRHAYKRAAGTASSPLVDRAYKYKKNKEINK